MNEAKQMEESDVKELGNFSLNYFNQVLGEDLVKELVRMFEGNSKELIKEFIFGLDVLVEMVNSPVVPMKRLLNNPDVTDSLAFIMKNKAIMEGKSEYFGCQTCPYTLGLINELFERKYLRLFNYILSDARELTVSLDGVGYRLTINRKFSKTTGHSTVNFKRLDYQDRRIVIPFHEYRLVK